MLLSTNIIGQAAGLHEVLDLTLTFVDHLPNLEEIAVTQGQLLSQKFAAATVECLTSSKSETRASALSLLEASIVKGVVGIDTVQKACERLKPAMQRTVGPMIARFAKQTAPVLPADKENKPGIESSWTSLDASAASNFPVRAAVGDSRIKHATLRNAPQQSPEPTAAHDVSPTQHPLIHRGGSQSLRLSKCTHWPEYPEEPTGDVLVNLKKHWSPCLPAISAAAFFPPSGISKQDDARAGCEVLSAALELEGADQPSAIIDQLDAILKWLTYSLCTKETTTGLQDLLSVLSGLLKQLLYKGHELSEAEACSFLPFLFEKASVAKVRFLQFPPLTWHSAVI